MHKVFNKTRNNTSFKSSVIEHLKTATQLDFLRPMQNNVLNYFKEYKPRGLLLFYKTGAGKSLTAAAIANYLINTENYDCIFISAKTLHSNIKDSFEKYTKLSGQEYKSEICYVALNASNMFAQVEKCSLTQLELFLDKKSKKHGSLENKLLIIDEAHNFFNSITNGSENATKLYKSIINSNCRVLFLSGSPIVNDPFEIGLCFNMLSGTILFPETYKDFAANFIGRESTNAPKMLKNTFKFCNRINGLVSYYDTEAIDSKAVDVPTELPLREMHIVMSKYQYGQYFESRKKEVEDQLKSKGVAREFALQKNKSSSSSYRAHSRQISNFAYPEYAIEKTRDESGKIIINTHFDKLDHNDIINNIKLYSPKISALIDTAISQPGKGLIYSQFIKTGIGIIAIILTGLGIKFSVISGEIKKEVVDNTIKIFNSTENKNGDILKLILVTATAAEGIDFKCLRHIHILEPYWNWSRILQIIGRGVRLNSHIDLPENERTVLPFIYISVHGIQGNKEITTDEYLFVKSTRNKQLINSFYSAIKTSSIDCEMYYNECRKCIASNKVLYSDNIDNDKTDPCVGNQLKATVFVYEGETYYAYEQDGEIYFAVLMNGKYIKVDEEMRIILLEYYKTIEKNKIL